MLNRRITSSPAAAQTPASAMGLQSLHLRRRRRHHHLRPSFSTITALVFLLISLFSAQLGGVLREEERTEAIRSEAIRQVLLTRRRLIGLGSSPPTCRSKCGNCLPCKPVHVPIQPGLTIPLEYYPEAWRCMCGNKLFIP